MNEDPNCHLTCPQCRQTVDVPWDSLRSQIVCDHCGVQFMVPPPAPQSWQDTPSPKPWPRGAVLALGGIICLTVAALMWYISIHLPLEEMRRHEPRVTYSMKRIVFIPLFAGAGAVMLLASPFSSGGPAHPDRVKRVRVLGVIGMVLLMVPGWFLYSWFEDEMRKTGYDRGLSGAQPNVIPVPKMEIPHLGGRPDTERLNAQLRDFKDQMQKVKEEARKGHP